MPQWVIDKNDFVKGMATSQEVGGFFSHMIGIDIYRSHLTTNVQWYNPVGALRSSFAGTDIAGATVTTNIHQFVKYNDGTTQFLYGFGGAKGYKINTGTDSVTAITTAAGFDNGAALFHSTKTTTGDYIYVSSTTESRRLRLSDDTWDPDSAAQHTFTNSSAFHPKFVKNSIMWMGDVDHLDKMEKDGTATDNVFDIPPQYTIVSISEWDRYLVIGASVGTNSVNTLSSRVFFWDMLSDSWVFDIVVDDAIVELKNKDGILYMLTTGNDFCWHQWTGNRFAPLAVVSDNTSVMVIEGAGKSVVDFDRGRVFWPVYDITYTDSTNKLELWSHGNRYPELPNVITKPYKIVHEGAGGLGTGAFATGTRGKYYAAYENISPATFHLIVFKNGNETAATATTVELDGYFGGSARLKTLNFIRFEFSPLESGDDISVYDATDLASSFTRLDGEASAGVKNSIRHADLGAVTSHRMDITKQFRELMLKINFESGTGDVAIRRIIIDFDYAPED